MDGVHSCRHVIVDSIPILHKNKLIETIIKRARQIIRIFSLCYTLAHRW